jgi:hypothetical protein
MIRCTLSFLVGLALLLLAPGFAAAQAEKPADVVGEWEVTVETPGGIFTHTMKLQRKADQLVGVMIRQDGKETTLNDIKLAGKTLTFSLDVSDHQLVYTGIVDRDSIKGTYETNGMRMNASARRVTPLTSSLAGKWKLAVEAHELTHHATLTLTEQNGKWSGKLVDEQGHESTLKELRVSGGQLDFVADLEMGGTVVRLRFSGALEDDRLKGTMEANGSTMLTTGERLPKP